MFIKDSLHENQVRNTHLMLYETLSPKTIISYSMAELV